MNSFGTYKWVSVWIILWYKDSGREGHSRVAKLKLILSDLWLLQPKRSYNVFETKTGCVVIKGKWHK